MLTCDNCDYLAKLDKDYDYGERCYCSRIPNCEIDKVVTTMDDEGGRYSILLINNPFKFGCLFHSKLKDYYEKITRDECIPKDDPRIKEL